MQTVSLSDFQDRCIILLKMVETVGESVLITENGYPLARIIPYEENFTEKRTTELLATLRGNIQHYGSPEQPIGESDWIALQC